MSTAKVLFWLSKNVKSFQDVLNVVENKSILREMFLHTSLMIKKKIKLFCLLNFFCFLGISIRSLKKYIFFLRYS